MAKIYIELAIMNIKKRFLVGKHFLSGSSQMHHTCMPVSSSLSAMTRYIAI